MRMQVHYLADPHRGSVWEEAIINCPRHIQLLCMSATVKNPEDLGAWISKARECVLQFHLFAAYCSVLNQQ
jgi:superfamily II RNA helicase